MMPLTQIHKLEWLAGQGKITAECSCNGWSNTFLYIDLKARAQCEEQLSEQWKAHASSYSPEQDSDFACRMAGSTEEAQRIVDGW